MYRPNRNSLRKDICIWLEAHDCEFTVRELSTWMKKDGQRVRAEIFLLKMEGAVMGDDLAFKRRFADLGNFYYKRKKREPKVALPGVHKLDDEDERFSVYGNKKVAA